MPEDMDKRIGLMSSEGNKGERFEEGEGRMNDNMNRADNVGRIVGM